MGGNVSKLNCSSQRNHGKKKQINPHHYNSKNRRRSSSSLREILKQLLSDAPQRRRNSENCLTLSSSMRNLEFVHGPPERIAGDGGSLIGPADFEFSSLLGQGGFGAVFKARRKTTGLEYAMKVQPIESLCRSARSSRNSTEDETIIQMERTVLISCRGHPFITGIEYAFHTDTYAVLGLEYVPGGTLAMCIENSPDGYLPLSLCKTYVMELASAIDFIHKKGVIYRDLKPSNVLITLKGHLKLTDFGLAGSTRVSMKECSSSNSLTQLDPKTAARMMGVKFDEPTTNTEKDISEGTHTLGDKGSSTHENHTSKSERSVLRRIKRRTVCGTTGYRPPEQVRERFLNYFSRNGYDERADWFSLGVCCYIMITGLRPFPSKKEMKEADPDRRTIDVDSLHTNINIDKKVLKLMMNDVEYQSLMVKVPFPYDVFRAEPNAKNFVSALLSRDPQYRLKFDGIMRHPWMKGESFHLQSIQRRPIPDWVKEHTQLQSMKSTVKRHSSPRSLHRRKTLSQCIDSMCSEIYERRTSSYADSFTQKWTTKARKKSICLFEHWNYMSEAVCKLEMKAIKQPLKKKLSAALSPNKKRKNRHEPLRGDETKQKTIPS